MEIIIETKEKTPSEVKFTGGNAATLLKMLGVSFENAEFNQAILTGADLSGCHLSTADLTDCDLRYADLRGCKLAEDCLKNAKFQHTTIFIFAVTELNQIIDELQQNTGQWDSPLEKLMYEFDAELPDTIQTRAIRGRTLSSGKAYVCAFECLIDEWFHWSVVRENLLRSAPLYRFAFYENEVESIQYYIQEILLEFLSYRRIYDLTFS